MGTKRRIWLIAAVLLVVVGLIVFYFVKQRAGVYDDAKKARIMEEYQAGLESGSLQPFEEDVPREVVTEDGRTFTVILSEGE